MRIYIIIASVLLLSLEACTSFNNRNQDPIAKVNNNYLFREDIAGIFPADVSSADSIKLARQYIDKWIRNQLFLRLAEANLPADEMNLDKQISDFRSSLLIFKYQQYLLNQKLDSIITSKEIEEYYQENANNFILDKTVITGIFLKVPVNAPSKNRLLEWFRNANDLLQIENYSSQHAVNYIRFDETWIYLDDILKEFPAESSIAVGNISNIDHITAEDNDYHYFLGILEHKSPRSQMPLSLASIRIRDIILNKRKIEFLNDLERKVLTEGLSKNAYQYF